LDNDVSIDKTIIREIKEETVLIISYPKLIYAKKFLRIDKPAVCLFYQAITNEDKISLSFEHSDYKWEKLNNLVKFDFQPWIKEVLKNIINII